jgi:hypothetical protein
VSAQIVVACSFGSSTNKAMNSYKKLFSLLVLLIGIPTVAPSALAQAQTPLTFSNNFFVTGDYVVAGAYNMTTKFTTINGVSYALGTINVPDTQNMGIQGVKSVPTGAQIVAALLYWQTVEKVGVAPGAVGTGQNGYFRPLFYSTTNGGPAAPGYSISGTNITSPGNPTVSWSSGGCSGGSTGKILRTYRADVAGALPNDANGNPTANGSFEVRLPSAGNSAPLTLGATLVVIYRIPSIPGQPSVPLNSIVIYDGDYGQSTTQLNMTQQLQGFYDADHNTVSKLTHIVGSGQSNKFQTVYLGSGTNKPVALPFPYGNRLPAFPGWYGTWDNPTWKFDSSSKNPSNPILEDSSTATTQVVPSSSMQGCVSWGAVIMSTTVKDTDNDGLLDSWENNKGYCDASVNSGKCNGLGDPAWVDLPNADPSHKDVFLQYDYMCSTITGPNSCTVGGANNDYSFDPRLAVDTEDGLNPHDTAVDKVVKAYANRDITLHPIAGNAILENQPNLLCADSERDASGNPTCPFPNELGTVGFRFGVESVKNFSINTHSGRIGECTLGTANCVPVFQTGKKDSYHYALFSDGVGVPNWFLFDGSLSSVKQTKNTVTFTTASPHGIKHILGDNVCLSGRVTVVFANTNPNLNGTFCALNVTANTFDITVPGSSMNITYSPHAEPDLGVADGNVTSMSGFSDVAGENVVVALGYGGWGPAWDPKSDGNKWQNKAGTFMHELGHNMGLTHGGTFYNKIGNSDYTPSFEVNCKPNVQSSMNYMFQFDLLQLPNQTNGVGKPLMVVDYSEDGSAPTLTESQPQGPNITGFSNLHYTNTASFQLPTNNSGAPHCNGSPLAANEKALTYVPFSVTSDFLWSNATGLDINFNGNATDVMHSHDEWDGTPIQGGVGPSPGLDFRQISAIGTLTTSGAGGGHLSGGGGGGHLSGGGGGGHLSGGGGGGHISGGGGGGHLSGGGGSPSEFTHEAANSYPRPPRVLSISQEEASPRYIDLNWFEPTFGTPMQYNIYRSSDGGLTFTLIHSNTGNPPATMYQDTVPCSSVGYEYRVTAVIKNDSGTQLESVATNTVPAANEPKLTGCYTVTHFTVPTNAVQGDTGLQISWTLNDDHFINQTTPPAPPTPWANVSADPNPVTRGAANTLVAIGPLPGNCTTSGRTKLVVDGAATNQFTSQDVPSPGPDTFSANNNTFTFTWNNSDAFCAGSYTFELDLDHVNSSPVQTQAGPNALSISIDVGDNEPRITTPGLPNATVGAQYSQTVTSDGGVGTVTWTFTGLPSIPAPGIAPQGSTGSTITVSGMTCVAGPYSVNASVIDSATPNANIGSQPFKLQVDKATTTTSVVSDANPSVFQQPVTFTVTVAPQYGCTPTGTVTLKDGANVVGSQSLTNGTATFSFSGASSLSVGVHNITASYGGDGNFNSSNGALTPLATQTVNPAQTQIVINQVSPSTAFVNQPITVTYAFSVLAPGAGTPVAPSGNISVTSTDGSMCLPQTPTSGVCTLSPVPSAAGNYTLTLSYPGDHNFVMSGANLNYTVYKLVFTTPPSNTGAGLPITPAVVVTAEDGGNNTFTTFTGGITLAIGSGTGTLSGTKTQSAVAGVATFNDLNIDKIANGYTLTASPAGGVPDATSNAFNVDTFYVDASGNFGTLDLATGTATQIGAATAPNSTGIDLTPTLQVYTYNTSGQLMKIDPSTGAATNVGSPGSIPDRATTGALTDGSYFGIDSVTGNLYSIDLTHGTTALVGTSSTAPVPSGCNFEASLTGSASVLYYTVGYSGTSCTTPQADTLYQINPTNGTIGASVQVTISGNPVNALAGSTFVGGTLYGFTTNGKEYSIDPVSGVATPVANTTPTTAIVGAGNQ